jgi:hypothetical protein
MAQTVTLQPPDEILQRCQRGATAARKHLEEFLVDRLMEALPPAADDVPGYALKAGQLTYDCRYSLRIDAL